MWQAATLPNSLHTQRVSCLCTVIPSNPFVLQLQLQPLLLVVLSL